MFVYLLLIFPKISTVSYNSYIIEVTYGKNKKICKVINTNNFSTIHISITHNVLVKNC